MPGKLWLDTRNCDFCFVVWWSFYVSIIFLNFVLGCYYLKTIWSLGVLHYDFLGNSGLGQDLLEYPTQCPGIIILFSLTRGRCPLGPPWLSASPPSLRYFLLALQPGDFLQAATWGNHKAYLICFLSLRHCYLLLSNVLKSVISYILSVSFCLF